MSTQWQWSNLCMMLQTGVNIGLHRFFPDQESTGQVLLFLFSIFWIYSAILILIIWQPWKFFPTDTFSLCKLYCIVLYCTILYCTVLYRTVLYYVALYCIVLYYIVVYCVDMAWISVCGMIVWAGMAYHTHTIHIQCLVCVVLQGIWPCDWCVWCAPVDNIL